MLRIGIVGLAQVGKTTLFRILTRAHGAGLVSGKPEAHAAVVHVPDARLDRLAAIYQPKKVVHASVEYVDTPGSVIDLARTGSQAAALREVDALAHVVRAFENELVPAPAGSVDPRRDIENVELELILSDLSVVEKRLERLQKDIAKQKSPSLEKEYRALGVSKQTLEKQTPLREASLTADDERSIRGFTFLSLKPVLYVLNLGEKDVARADAAEAFAREAGLKQRPRTGVTAICGPVEAELAELADTEAAEFLSSYGLKESAIARLIRSSYRLLGLISFFTVGEDECRAWTVRSGATALEAAGEIHSDIQRGFIRAEVVKYEDLIAAGSLAEARNRALLRLEGKEYRVEDGEVVHFRHSG
ncbi:MAG: redox-regulated ATPase YchF [Acidobacteria bacterium]|nr:MAG: redox-regulated ATPase YchF [Acidobacteriota bacterium]